MTNLNARGVFSGIGEEGLTEDQCRDLGAIDFDASGFDAVYCSPAPRCKETAQCLEFEAFQRLDADYTIPGGESRAEHLSRIVEWLREISIHRRVLAVTHGGTIDFLFRRGTDGVVHGGDHVFAGPNAALSVFEVCWPVVSVVEHGVPLVP